MLQVYSGGSCHFSHNSAKGASLGKSQEKLIENISPDSSLTLFVSLSLFLKLIDATGFFAKLVLILLHKRT